MFSKDVTVLDRSWQYRFVKELKRERQTIKMLNLTKSERERESDENSNKWRK